LISNNVAVWRKEFPKLVPFSPLGGGCAAVIPIQTRLFAAPAVPVPQTTPKHKKKMPRSGKKGVGIFAASPQEKRKI
jgi:hypothetical protein